MLLFLAFSVLYANATHIMGGEITWECIKDPASPNYGQYIFTMKLYRDCDGVTLPTTSQNIVVHNHPTVTSIMVDFILQTDISPDCDVVNSGNAALDCITNPVGAVEEYIYQSQPITLAGVPPTGATPLTNGWHFTWDSCCRNGAISNLILSSPTSPSEGFTLRASMYRYVDPMGIPVDTDPCFDSSPQFNESPQTIICTGYPFSYTHNASDEEMDSLSYSWDDPLDDLVGAYNPPLNPIVLPFIPPYSNVSPLPGNPILNSQTGEINYFSQNTSGNFVTVVRVDAYKCGQLIAQIYREIQAVLISCPSLGQGINNPPVVSPAFPPPTQFFTSVNAGSFVSFNISATDNDVYANGSPQDITLEISGGQLADDFITTTACNNPPCATFTNGFGLTPPFSNPGLVDGVFEWQTACSHISSDAGCGRTSNLYTFAIKAYDDYCPANAITIATVTVEVTKTDSLTPPDLECVFLDGNGDISLNWNHNPSATNATVYNIYGASNIGGPYNLIANVNYPIDNYVIPSNMIPQGAYYYYLTNESTCADESLPSDTITPIEFEISSGNVSCWDDSDGYIAIEVLTPMIFPFSYYINGVLNNNPSPNDTIFQGLSTGIYDITVSDNGSCQITQPIYITAPGFPLQVLVADTMNTCYGSNLGLASASGSGGTPPYTYEWFNFNNNVAFSTNDTVFGLSAGSYYVNIEDANGCDTSTSVQVISPQSALTGSPQIFGVACKGDSTGYIVADGGGGYAPYQYYWMNAMGDTLQSTSYIIIRDTLSSLSEGSYSLHVYDSKGCFIDYNMQVGEPTLSLSIDSLITIQDIDCYGDSIGKATITVSGGMPTYTYLWDNGETSIIADELKAGYRHISVTDAWGCEVADSIYIHQNPEIQSTVDAIQHVSCYGNNDGIATVTSTGGVPSYTYFWSTGHTGFSMPDTAYNLYHGSYYVTTRDALGCEVVDSVDISQPEPLTMEASQLAWISCFGADDGLAYAYALGGTPPYTFTWMPNGQQGDTINTLTPGLHTVTVVDARGCTASDTVHINEPPLLEVHIDDAQTILAYCIGVNTASLSAIASGGTPGYSYLWDDNLASPQTTPTASSLYAGVYTITVTDTRGCIATDTRDIDTLTNTMDVVASSLVQYNGGYYISCFGANDGQAMAHASGAHPPYTYQWYGPNGYNDNNDSISNLSAGMYSVTVMDTNNCMVNTSIDITEPAQLLYTTLGSSPESCVGGCNGSVDINIIGGTAPYYYDASELGVYPFSNMQQIVNDSLVTDLCQGLHTVYITDANNCEGSLQFAGIAQQTVGTGPSTTAMIDMSSITHVDCFGSNTGELNVLAPNPNTTNYSYSWQNVNNPGVTIANGIQASNLISGTYVLFAHYQDAASFGTPYPGCTNSDTAFVSEVPQMMISNSITHVACFGGNTGSISTSVSGGTSPYSYQWNPANPASATINNLLAGAYTVTVIDQKGCQKLDTFQITQPSLLSVSVVQNGFDLQANSPTGGTPPFTYSWVESSNPGSSLQGGSAYTVTNYGTYYVIVTDANGCVSNSNSFTYTATGIYETGVEFAIYPNPFKGEATLDFGQVIKEAQISIIDVYGKVIEKMTVYDTDKYVISSHNKASGVYFVEIEYSSDRIFGKFIVK